ncbi:hypothetical protein TruAng_006730 [Truncatella angustata]|nr:hypothetical protein TruAng_006730 [Truncatella angustata]
MDAQIDQLSKGKDTHGGNGNEIHDDDDDDDADDYPPDSKIQDLFECVLNDLVNDERFILSFFSDLTNNEKSYTFSNDRSFDPKLAFYATSKSHNILHHFIQNFIRLKPEKAIVSRFVNFIGLLLKRFPDLLLDGLKDDNSPLDEAVSGDDCLEIIQAMCEHGMERAENRYPNGDQNGTTITHDVAAADSGKVGINEGEHEISPRVAWSKLVKINRDTCLHKAIKKKKNDYAHYLLAKIEHGGAVDKILSHFGQDGLTPLHLAVDFSRCYQDQVELVEKLIDLYPKALTLKSGPYFQNQQVSIAGTNKKYAQSNNGRGDRDSVAELKENLSPYRYFMDTREREENCALEPPGRLRKEQLRSRTKIRGNAEDGRRIEELLRLSCMRHYGRDRTTITDLLPLSLGQIHFDLNPRTEVSQELLNYIAKSAVMRFEPYLQYVGVPNVRVVNVRMERLEAESWWESHSRKDYVYIFEWLRTTMKVKRILKIVVEDDPNNVHSDEAIERAVASFDIEEWDWMKLDMCSDTILAAARNVRDLSLYWSGNRAILKSWAASDGLVLLKELRKIRIMMPESIESHDRTDNTISKFKSNLEMSWVKCWADEIPYRKPPHIDIQPVFTQTYMAKKLSETEREEKGRKQVAIIDDGLDIDRDDIGRNVALGETFYDNKGHWPGFYQSAYGHGTLMANQIRQICPKVQLYVAKLNEVWSDGKPQITAKSAAQAIDWARNNEVDIISMSWSIQTPEEVDLLETAVKKALDDEILLFCASNDQGNTGEIPYPARIKPEKIFKIGSATALGFPEAKVQKCVDFIAPGSEFVKRAAHEDDQGFAEPRAGSSIATARCAGLAAVILQCIVLYQKSYDKKRVRSHKYMKAMLEELVDKTDSHHYLKVWKVFETALDNAKLDKDFEWNVICKVAGVFLGKIPWLPQSTAQPGNAGGT